MYQSIYIDRNKRKVHLWDDISGYTVESLNPYTYGYLKDPRGQKTAIDGKSVRRIKVTNEVMKAAANKGQIKTLLGRRCRFPKYEPILRGSDWGKYIPPEDEERMQDLQKMGPYLKDDEDEILKDKDGNPSAFWETILGHIDMNIRKTADFKSDHLNHLINLRESHKSKMHIDLDIRLNIKK